MKDDDERDIEFGDFEFPRGRARTWALPLTNTTFEYVHVTKIVRIYEDERIVRGYVIERGTPNAETVVEKEKKGWIVQLEGGLSLHMSNAEHLEVGMPVEVIIRPVVT